MRHRNRWLLVGGVLLVIAVAAVIIWRVVSPPEITAFYDPPDSLPDPSPGALIRWESMESRDDNQVWRILYVSTDLNGDPISVSGLIAVPDGTNPDGGFPLIAVAHGTTGVAQGCAPSLTLYDGTEVIPSLYDDTVEPFLDQGYAVVMSDYQGLGAPGDPSYVIGRIEGQNVLDSIRAARAFPEVSLSDQVVLQGHSQGGHAAAFALQLAPDYAPELVFDGAVLLAPATDLEGMFQEILDKDESSAITALMLLAVSAWSEAYPDRPIDQVTTRLGQEAVDRVITNTCVTISALVTSFVAPSRLVLPDTTTTWAALLDQNTPAPGPWDPPVFIGQGGEDVIIFPELTDGFVEGLCASGSLVEYHTYPEATHFNLPAVSAPDVIPWIAARFTGEPPPSTCTGS